MKQNEMLAQIAGLYAKNYEGVIADFYSGNDDKTNFINTLYFESEWMITDEDEIRLGDGDCYFCINLHKKTYLYKCFPCKEYPECETLEITDPDTGKRVQLNFVVFFPVDSVVGEGEF